MEVLTESSKPPPVEPQSSGKINKAAFKLFGKRRSGAGMASIFSVRNKGEGHGGGGVKALVRSKTHDGITGDATSTSPACDGPEGTPGRPAESASSEQLQSSATTAPGPPRSSLSKSLSFFSLLRRGSVRAGDGVGTAGTAGSVGGGRRSRGGLRGFFSSLRWRRKERPSQEEAAAAAPAAREEAQEEEEEAHAGDVVLTAAPAESVEVVTENVTLTLDSDSDRPPLTTEDGGSGSGSAAVHCGKAEAVTQGTHAESGRESSPLPHAGFDQRSPDVSPLRVSISRARDGGGGRLGSPARLASDSCLTPPLDRSLADPPSEPSVDRLCSMFNDVTSLKSFDSLTGCGDIIADVEDEPGNGNGNGNGNGGSGTSSGTASSGTTSSNGGGGGGRRASERERGSPTKPATLTSQLPAAVSATPVPVSTFLPAHQRARAAANAAANAASTGASGAGPKKPSGGKPAGQGSGVVAYMGGGEEMASPEGVDDADMQGLWHMLPQKGDDDSPDLSSHRAPVTSSTRADKQRPPPVKGLGLSKIPVCGSGRPAKQPPTRPSPPPTDKEPVDAAPSDEGYWDSPTPVAEDEDAGFLRRELRLPRESCSGDALYDLYDPDSPGAAGSDEDDLSSPSPSTGDVNLSPQSQSQSQSQSQAPSSSSSSFLSMKGSTSLPRDSKIPVSVRHTPPPHSSSQGELSAAVSPTSPTSPTSPMSPAEPPAKSQIPPPRTRIPVSKVPVRRAPGNANKNASAARNRK
ncbi:APC membrane recruitment protein 2 [Sardina pilchardus]|uniref:APC membrane recruitment protein 2 n=1 Tax=Sardina pilchardus TaxID=27697 RepID=UPI002E10E8B4